MFPDYHYAPALSNRKLRPDRRPLPRASEIRTRIKRALSCRED
jgi:hypothetical protein